MLKITKFITITSILVLFTACSHTNKSPIGQGMGAGSDSSVDSSTLNSTGKNGVHASDRVFFDYNSSVIRPEERPILDKQANWLNKNSKVTVTIEGHCDERGTREYNLALGERRANAAKKYLVAEGVSASRISTISYGKERPAVAGSNESAYAQNRRAVTILINQ